MKNKDYKTITFYKFAKEIGAVGDLSLEELNPNDILFSSYLFLNKDQVITSKEKKQLEIFKDKYNRYLEYCIERDFVEKNSFSKVEKLNVTGVPDMSKIKVPDLSKELAEFGFDPEKIGNIFKKITDSSQN